MVIYSKVELDIVLGPLGNRHYETGEYRRLRRAFNTEINAKIILIFKNRLRL